MSYSASYKHTTQYDFDDFTEAFDQKYQLETINKYDMMSRNCYFQEFSHENLNISATIDHIVSCSKSAIPGSCIVYKLYEICAENDSCIHIFYSKCKSSTLIGILAQRYLHTVHVMSIIGQKLPDYCNSVSGINNKTVVDEPPKLLQIIQLLIKDIAILNPSRWLIRLVSWLMNHIIEMARNKTDKNEKSFENSGARYVMCNNEQFLKYNLRFLKIAFSKCTNLRLHIESLANFRSFYKSLEFMTSEAKDPVAFVLAIDILARLVLPERLDEYVFGPQNVKRSVKMVLMLLDACSGYEYLTRLECVDLLTALASKDHSLANIMLSQELHHQTAYFLLPEQLTIESSELIIVLNYLGSVIKLGSAFENQIIPHIIENGMMYQLFQITLDPKDATAMQSLYFLKTLFKKQSEQLQRAMNDMDDDCFQSVVAGWFRYRNNGAEYSKSLDKNDVNRHISMQVDFIGKYQRAVLVTQLLVMLCEIKRLRIIIVKVISLNQSASIIQLESSMLASSKELDRFEPKLSFYTIILLGNLLKDSMITDDNMQKLYDFLQSPPVTSIVGFILVHGTMKSMTNNALAFTLKMSSHRKETTLICDRISASVRADENLFSAALAESQAHIRELASKLLSKEQRLKTIQTNMLKELQKHMDRAEKQDLEYSSKEQNFARSMRQCEEKMTDLCRIHEKKIQEKDALLREEQARNDTLMTEKKRLEKELGELKRSYDGCERELLSVKTQLKGANAQNVTQNDKLLQLRKKSELRNKDLQTNAHSLEMIYKELVLVSKSHKGLADREASLQAEIRCLQSALVEVRSQNKSLGSKQVENAAMIDSLRLQVSRLEDAATRNRMAFMAESKVQEERLNTLQKEYDHTRDNLESLLAEVEGIKGEHFEETREYSEQLSSLKKQLECQTKLKALIHQLSSATQE